ncbi:MAG: hypothetical protein K2J63_00685 [Muribaculaceae bacterium]|nr:hypothetical protein [Muribaculaceae bacterium]MDE6793804.1 hypothetical protein [Muribaculaceae bacterium]
MRKTIVKWLILTSLFAYVACMAIWARGEAAKLTCTGIEVKIESAGKADSVTINGVKQELAKFPKKIVGTPVPRLNTREIENYLAAFSNFEDVECSLSTTGKLKVDIIPMIPELRVFDGEMSYYINKDGKRIESKPNFFVDVPVVTGNFTPSFTPRNLLSVSRFIQRDPILRHLVGMIEVRDADNIILIPRIHGHVINLGDTTNLQEKRQAIVTMYRKVMPYKGWDTYDTISVKFRRQIVATRRNKARNLHSLPVDEDVDPEEATLPEPENQSAAG